MIGRNNVRVLLMLPRAVLTILGVGAIIVGILAMHVWMGGHGPTAHSAAAHPVAMAPTLHVSSDPHSLHAGSPSGTVDAVMVGCAGSCDDEGSMLGLCVLALIITAVLAFLLPVGRLVPGTTLLRGPPRILLRPRAIPAPSLIRLCISRT